MDSAFSMHSIYKKYGCCSYNGYVFVFFRKTFFLHYLRRHIYRCSYSRCCCSRSHFSWCKFSSNYFSTCRFWDFVIQESIILDVSLKDVIRDVSFQSVVILDVVIRQARIPAEASLNISGRNRPEKRHTVKKIIKHSIFTS